MGSRDMGSRGMGSGVVPARAATLVDAGDPVVNDWRTEMSPAFYRASRTAPMGVR